MIAAPRQNVDTTKVINVVRHPVETDVRPDVPKAGFPALAAAAAGILAAVMPLRM